MINARTRPFVARKLFSALAIAAAMGAAAVGTAGCRRAKDPEAYRAKQVANVQTTLHGAWGLAGYQPNIVLEPMLDLWMKQEMPSLLVHFDNGILRADSNVTHLTRGYSVKDVNAPYFKLVTTSSDGLSYDVDCEIADGGNKIIFHGLTPPWKGQGTLVRRAP